MLIIRYGDKERTALLKVLGLTLVERSVLASQSAGYKNISVVCPMEDRNSVESVLKANSQINIDVKVLSSLPKKIDENEVSFLFGNQVCTPLAMNTLVKPLSNEERARAIDNAGASLGAFRIISSAYEKMRVDSDVSLGSVLTHLEEISITHSPSSDSKYLHEINSNSDISKAENFLLKSLIKDADGIISRNINRKISLSISRRLVKTSVVPNQITGVVFLIGILSGVFAFFMNSYWGFLLGGFCYYLSAILDGCDGEISRLKYQGTPLGAWLDTVVDDLAGLSYILGLYGRLALDRDGQLWMWIGILTIAMYLLTILPRYWVMAKTGSGDYQKLAAKTAQKEVSGLAKVVDGVRNVIFRTDFIPFYAFITAASSYLLVFAIPFSIGCVASAIDSITTVLKVKKL